MISQDVHSSESENDRVDYNFINVGMIIIDFPTFITLIVVYVNDLTSCLLPYMYIPYYD